LTNTRDTQNATNSDARATQSADLALGTRLGHYRIDALLGRGGSGTVYRGFDTKLNRPVAIKFLSAAVADDDAQRRFRQEAATASSLRHPHIVTVYDVGEHDGRQFIVSEIVDGGTLEDWTRAAKRSWRQCTELITGVADALAAAHAAGVLHRDVKPGNILIDGNGYAKLSDFGLAKLVQGWTEARGGASADSQHTRAGIIVGTVAYMSPEQATGQPLDARSDVFSFGIVLYELLAGRRPFDAANDLGLLKSIANATPAPLPEHVPELLRNAVDKALEKEPADRYQTMQDLVADLRRATRKTGTQAPVAPAEKLRRTRVAWLIGAAAVFIAVGAAATFGALRWLEKPAPQAKRMQFTIPAPGYQVNGLAISPDGTRIAYVSNTSGTRQIWLRPIDALEARALPGTEGARATFWSPDSRYLAFGADGQLKKLDVNGGPAQTIADLPPNLYGGTWSENGTILYNATVTTFGLAPTSGGDKRSWPAQPKADDAPRVLPEKLPDGDHFLYVSPARPLGSSGRTLFVGSLATGKSSRLADFPVGDDVVPNNLTRTTIAYADGYVLYLLSGNGGTLSAPPFDTTALAVRGAPVPVAEHVAEYSVSATGVLVYRELDSSAIASLAAAAPERRLVWVDRRGQRVAELPAPAGYRLPTLSPDGRRIAIRAPGQRGLGDIWTVDAENGIPTRMTFDDAEDSTPVWSPDGAQLAFNSGRKSALARIPSAIYRRAANGTGADELLLGGGDGEILAPIGWSGDGRLLLFARTKYTSRERVDIWVLELDGERTARPIIESPARKILARLSPDGRWLAYVTDESKVNEVVVQPFPDVGRGKWQISRQGGSEPHWRGDGRELYYLAPNGDLMAVDVEGDGETFMSGMPHTLFATGAPRLGPDTTPDYNFDAAPDGQRFLLSVPVVSRDDGSTASERTATAPTTGATATTPAVAPDLPLHVIVNWTAGLPRQ
jgi:Tol biopolymer transport system component